MHSPKHTDLDSIEQKLIGIFMQFSKMRGRPPKMASILAHCVVLGNVTQKQLRSLTKFSMGSISMYLNDLEKQGTIEKKMDAHTHNYIYSVKGNVFGMTGQSTSAMPSMTGIIQSFLAHLQESLNSIPPTTEGYSNISHFIQSMQASIQIMNTITTHLMKRLAPMKKTEPKKEEEEKKKKDYVDQIVSKKEHEVQTAPAKIWMNTEKSEKDKINDHQPRTDSINWSPQVRAIELEIVQFYFEVIPKFNQRNPIVSAITAYFLTRKRLTQIELQKLSGYSAGMVSECLRELIEAQMITKETLPKSHTHIYSMNEVPYTSVRMLLSFESKFDDLLRQLKEIQQMLDYVVEEVRNSEQYQHIHKISTELIALVSLFPEMKKIFQEEFSKINENHK